MKALSLLTILFIVSVLGGCNNTTKSSKSDNQANCPVHTIKLLQETRTTQYFTGALVPLNDITTIIDAGRNASSGRNNQKWYFGGIINQEIIKEIASTIPKRKPRPANDNKATTPARLPKAQFDDAPAIIALASPNSNDFNLGLACQNMVVAAASLGYGTKIVMSGRDQLNTPKYMEILQIPEGMKVAVVIYVGKEDTELVQNADAITGASSRKPMQEVSIIIE